MVSSNQYSNINWDVRNVLVGVLHNRAQLEICTRHRFYHIPRKMLPCPHEKIEFIALYQSKQLFGKHASGVKQYGKVENCRILNREDILEIPCYRNPTEQYCRFDVSEWLWLPNIIRAAGIPLGVSMTTNLLLLQSSRYFPELFIHSEKHFKLYDLLRKSAIETAKTGISRKLPAKNGMIVMIIGRDIGVYTSDGRYEAYNLREFLRKPYGFMCKMEALLEIPDYCDV